MAEVVGLVASLITVAGVGAKLANKLLRIGDRAILADHQMNRVAMNISMFSGTLKHFASVADANKDLLSEEGREIATLLMEQCDGVFKDFTDLAVLAQKDAQAHRTTANAGPSRPRRGSVLRRLTSFFETPKVTTLLAELEYLKSTLSLLIQTLQLAVTTAAARKESMLASPQAVSSETTQRLESERVHVETLIMTRQLTMNILIQRGADEVNPDLGNHVSPANSEESFEEVKHPQLLLPAPEGPSTSIVRLGDPSMNYLHRAFPGESQSNKSQEENKSMSYTSHSQIIDQLLGRWTRINEIELDMRAQDQEEKDQGKAKQTAELTKPRGKRPTPELTLSRVTSPEDIDGSTIVESPMAENVQTNGQRASSLTPHSSLPPPPKNTKNLSINSKLVPGPPLYRSMSTPGHDTPRPLSPQPTLSNAIAVPNRENQLSQYSSRRSRRPRASPSVSPRGSLVEPSPLKRGNWHQPNVTDSASEMGSDDGESPDEEARLGLGIEWRIKVGPRYWDLLDSQIVGPRTPMLPTESLDDLLNDRDATTEIALSWVSEAAMKESKLRSRLVSVKDEYMPPGAPEEKRWVVDRPLRFSEVDSLVTRTIDILDANKRNSRTVRPPQGTQHPSQSGSKRPHIIQTQGHPAQPPMYQSPTAGQTPRDAQFNSNAWAQMNRPPGPTPRQPSYHDPTPGSRPTTADSKGSRLSGDHSVRFTPSTHGDTAESTRGQIGIGERSPRSRDFGREAPRGDRAYDEGNYHYARRPQRYQDREAHRDHDHSDGSDERKRERRKKQSRTAKIGASMVGMVGLLDAFDAFL